MKRREPPRVGAGNGAFDRQVSHPDDLTRIVARCAALLLPVRRRRSIMKVLNILVRRYLPLERFDAAVAFHETLIGQKARLRFDYREHDLRLA
jgi:hypothetical protein